MGFSPPLARGRYEAPRFNEPDPRRPLSEPPPQPARQRGSSGVFPAALALARTSGARGDVHQPWAHAPRGGARRPGAVTGARRRHRGRNNSSGKKQDCRVRAPVAPAARPLAATDRRRGSGAERPAGAWREAAPPHLRSPGREERVRTRRAAAGGVCSGGVDLGRNISSVVIGCLLTCPAYERPFSRSRAQPLEMSLSRLSLLFLQSMKLAPSVGC